MTPTDPPRQRRRFLRLALFALALLLAAVGVAPWIVSHTALKEWVIAKAAADLDGKATAREASLSWFGPVELRDVVLTDPDGRPALTVPRAVSSKTLPQILLNTRDPGTITLHNPTLAVVTEGATTNVERAIAKYLEDDGSPSKPGRFALTVIVEKGTIRLSDAAAPGEGTLHAFDLALTMPKSRAEPIQLVVGVESRTAGIGTLKVDSKFAPVKSLALDAAAFDLAQLAPLVRRFAAGTVAKGTLTAALAYKWAENETALNGTAGVRSLELAGPWLGKDTLALDSLALDSKLARTAGILKAERLVVTCDVGSATFQGEVDPSADADAMLARPGIALDAEIDLAKLAAKLPGLLHIKKGVEIREGTVTAKVRSNPGEHGPAWAGTVGTTHLVGTNAGQRIEWQQPLAAAFNLHSEPGGIPYFDKLEVKADFIGLAARGQRNNFVAAANIDLKKLSDHLAEFAAVGYALGGSAGVTLNNTLDAGTGAAAIKGTAKLQDFTMLDRDNVGVRERQLDLAFDAAGKKDAKAFRIDTGSIAVAAGEDSLSVGLKEPIADVRALGSGVAEVKLAGDFARWHGRLGPIFDLPPAWKIAGTGTLTATVKMSDASYLAEGVAADVKGARFEGAGLNVDEPTLKLTANAAYGRKTKTVTFTGADLSCNTVGASARRVVFDTATNGLSGDVNLQANLGRLMRTLNVVAAIDGLAKGKVTFGGGPAGATAFDADLNVGNFHYGPAADPTWVEKSIAVQVKGTYAGDAVRFGNAKLSRDGFAAEGKGTIDRLSTVFALDIDGTLTYDLAKIEPQLKAYLGKSGQATGTGVKPFRLAGNLSDGGKNLAVNVGGDLPGSTRKNPLAGNAAVEWQSLKAHGFDVGRAELKAKIDDGFVRMSPVEATFGGGKVKLEPTVQLNPGAYDLSFAQGQVVQKAKLTPAACAEALGYALPLLANVAEANGTISFDLAENRIPLADPALGTVVGTLTIHDAEVSPNELIAQIAGLFTQKPLKLRLAQDERVPIRLEKGRVHHSNLSVTIDGVVVRTSGSVGVVDSSLDLVVEVPLTQKMVGGLVPANRPLIRDALAKQTVRIAVKGTMGKPLVDPNAFRNTVGRLVQDAMKDAAAGAVEDLFKKGLDGFLPKK